MANSEKKGLMREGLMQVSLSCGSGTKVAVVEGSRSPLYGTYFHIYLDDAMITLEQSVAVELAEILHGAVGVAQRSAEAEIQ
jgi:hypothetical protein